MKQQVKVPTRICIDVYVPRSDCVDSTSTPRHAMPPCTYTTAPDQAFSKHFRKQRKEDCTSPVTSDRLILAPAMEGLETMFFVLRALRRLVGTVAATAAGSECGVLNDKEE
jgi:hypothetical protein